jgi:hypothetical protein
VAVSPNNTFDRLYRALRPVDPTNLDGPWALILTGTTNIIGGGAGGTSTTDNNPFTPGGTSITPAGGYVGGRTIASGNAGAIALSPSGAVLVHVIAGGAGGGLAQLQVVGTDNSNFNNVGWPSGAAIATLNTVPVMVVNQSAAGGGQATVNIAGQPISVVGSTGVTPLASFTVNMGSVPTVNLGLGTVNIGNIPGIVGSVRTTGLGGSIGVIGAGGSLGALGIGGSVGALGIGGSMGVTQIGAPWSVVGSMQVTPATDFTVWMANPGGGGGGFASVAVYGSPAMPVYVVGTVNVSNPAAGGGFASVAVYGSPANPVYNVGSVNVVNAVGIFGSVSVIGSVNPHGVFAPAGSVNVVGSVGVTPLASFTVNLGSIPTVNLGLGTVNIGNAHGIFGSVSMLGSVNVANAIGIFGSTSGVASVNLAPGGIVGVFGSVSVLGSVNIGGQPISVVGSVGATNLGGSVFSYIDARGLTTPTTWQLAFAGSGYLAIAIASLSTSPRAKINGLMLISTGTTTITFQSPSGTYLTGSMRLLPGAGIAVPPVSHWPIFQSASNGTLFIHATGTENVGGALQGYIE